MRAGAETVLSKNLPRAGKGNDPRDALRRLPLPRVGTAKSRGGFDSTARSRTCAQASFAQSSVAIECILLSCIYSTLYYRSNGEERGEGLERGG